jgi:F-type H+-transporting ATPase subunit delta
MKFTTTQYAQALYDSVQQVNPKDYDVLLDNFVKILAQNGDLGKHAEIEAEYKRLEMKAKGISSAEVTVAADMEINSGLINQLNQIIGSKVDVEKKIDDSIIGGVVVRVDDTLIDVSVKTQLSNLNKELKI